MCRNTEGTLLYTQCAWTRALQFWCSAWSLLYPGVISPRELCVIKRVDFLESSEKLILNWSVDFPYSLCSPTSIWWRREGKKKKRWKICFVCVPSAGAAEEENSHSGYTALIKSSGLLVACQNQVGRCYWGIVIFSSLNSANLSGVLWAQQKSLPACQLFGFKPGREESELRFYLYWEFTVLSASWSEDGCSPQLLWMGAMVLSAFRAADEWLQEKVLICFLCLFLLVYIGDIRGLNTQRTEYFFLRCFFSF